LRDHYARDQPQVAWRRFLPPNENRAGQLPATAGETITMPTLKDAQDVTAAVTQIMARIRKGLGEDGTSYSVEREHAILHAVCADADAGPHARRTCRDAMALAFIEAIVSADLDCLFADAA
jgi:hypothetical protein